MQKKIVLIGAGSSTFGFGVLGDIFRSEILPGCTIVLHDINAERLNSVKRVGAQYLQDHSLPYGLTATTSREEALQGADFCIISIEVGDRFVLWEQDWRIPQQYGNRQVYGENGGPGGLFHSLRIIPPILEVCADIDRICPDAHVFSLSNPMSRICLAVSRKYPDLKFTGLCHEIAHLPETLEAILGRPFSEMDSKSGGLNHFTVLLEVKEKAGTKDLYPELRSNVLSYLETLPELTDLLREWNNNAPKAQFKGRKWSDRHLIKAVFEKFGYLPVTVDSHFGEYIQWAQDLVDHWSIIDFYGWYKDWSYTHEAVISPTGSEGHERVIPIIEGILTDSQHEELAVNLLNKGFIENLSKDVVVEVPAIIDKSGVHGITLGAAPKGISGLWNNQVPAHDLTVEAALNGSRELALQALLVDPTVDSLKGAEGMLDTILALQKEYLGYIK
ncbi:alpha-glucosidase [candidate division KSB3 bacterium]|uniref:Alpha-glucosidase n=1 Tax=candidate division KSB3 bacterium TaxID=2044937 RepID=A0A2G6E5T1_9BACT|nr:MAG: alpha-glucosidase [candidate division KSB3 bacterium]PIE29955.1 MAG: alpha-glucosidase [candidate division KSB3 bacterium]